RRVRDDLGAGLAGTTARVIGRAVVHDQHEVRPRDRERRGDGRGDPLRLVLRRDDDGDGGGGGGRGLGRLRGAHRMVSWRETTPALARRSSASRGWVLAAASAKRSWKAARPSSRSSGWVLGSNSQTGTVMPWARKQPR